MADLLAQFKALPNDKKALVVGGIGVGGFALYTLSKRGGVGGSGGSGNAPAPVPPQQGGSGGGGSTGSPDSGALAQLQDQLTKSASDQQATNAGLLAQIQALAKNSVAAFNQLGSQNQQGLQSLAQQTNAALSALGQQQQQQPNFAQFASQLQSNLQAEVSALASSLNQQYGALQTGFNSQFQGQSSGIGNFGGGGFPQLQQSPQYQQQSYNLANFNLRGLSGYGGGLGLGAIGNFIQHSPQFNPPVQQGLNLGNAAAQALAPFQGIGGAVGSVLGSFSPLPPVTGTGGGHYE